MKTTENENGIIRNVGIYTKNTSVTEIQSSYDKRDIEWGRNKKTKQKELVWPKRANNSEVE